jgi:RepB DNA-primase N-terminal domain
VQVPLEEMTGEQLKEQRARVVTLWKKVERGTLWGRVALAANLDKCSEFEPWHNFTPEQWREAHTRYVLLGGRADAERFLKLLDPTVDGFTFQTFDDSGAKRPGLARIFNGTLAQHWETLCRLNAQGAGVYVTVNATDGKGRATGNIKRVRALFVDLDGAPLEPPMRSDPHIVVTSSPGRFHTYWRVSDVPLDQFTDLQRGLIALFDGDPKVFDLPRVMRLPGFFHCKGDPFLSRIVASFDDPAYHACDFDFASDHKVVDHFKQYAEDSKSRTQKLNDAALADLAAWVPELFPKATPYHEGFRVASADLGRDLEEAISFRSNGIKDFGLHDQDDPLGGQAHAR